MNDIENMPAKKGKATEVSHDIANILVSLRDRFHLTQRAIADMLGVSFQQYQKYEKAKDRLSLEKAVRLTSQLGLSLDVFQGASADASGFAEEQQAGFGNDHEHEWVQLLRDLPATERNKLLEQARAAILKSEKK